MIGSGQNQDQRRLHVRDDRPVRSPADSRQVGGQGLTGLVLEGGAARRRGRHRQRHRVHAPGRWSTDGLQIVFTRKTTDLSGLVTDDRDEPVLDATVVIFPANKDLWTYSSRYVRSARPDTNGSYSFKSLPPSEDYLVIAVQNLEQGQGSDPEFLARAEEAKRFSLNEGETKAVDIKLSKLVP